MFAKLRCGWSMAIASFGVLKQHPKLAIFPAMSGTIFLLVAAAIFAPFWPKFVALFQGTGVSINWPGDFTSGSIWFYAGLFAAGFVLSTVTIFFNVALIHSALRCHAGQEPSVRGGFAAAMSAFPQILGWAFVATTVGFLLNMIQETLKEYLGWFGGFVGRLLEFSWVVVTYFVLPVLASEKVGPITAVKRSAAILRSKWGESLVGEATFGLVGLLFFLLAMAMFGIGIALALVNGPTALGTLGAILMALGVVGLIATTVVMQTLSGIFQSGVYVYATTGQVPAALDPEMVQGAFRPKAKA